MGARTAAFDPADMQGGTPKIDLIPTQVHGLGRAQAMPKGDQNHGGVAMAMAVLPSRRHKLLDLMPSQVFPASQVSVLPPPRHDCSIFGSSLYQPQAGISHLKTPVGADNCSKNGSFTNSCLLAVAGPACSERDVVAGPEIGAQPGKRPHVRGPDGRKAVIVLLSNAIERAEACKAFALCGLAHRAISPCVIPPTVRGLGGPARVHVIHTRPRVGIGLNAWAASAAISAGAASGKTAEIVRCL